MITALLAASLAAPSVDTAMCRSTPLTDALSRYIDLSARQDQHAVAAFFGSNGVMYPFMGRPAKGAVVVERRLIDARYASHMGWPDLTPSVRGWEAQGTLRAWMGNGIGYDGRYRAIWRCGRIGWVVVRMDYDHDGDIVVPSREIALEPTASNSNEVK